MLATLHANNAPETLDRIINMFPHDQHPQIFLDLSQYLRAIISQRLVLGKDGKRVAAIELMLNTPHIPELVRKGDVRASRKRYPQRGEGHAELRRRAVQLYLDGRVSMEDALANADSRTNLEARSTSVEAPAVAGALAGPAPASEEDMLAGADPASAPNTRRLSD